jgi:hypothetical protein
MRGKGRLSSLGCMPCLSARQAIQIGFRHGNNKRDDFVDQVRGTMWVGIEDQFPLPPQQGSMHQGHGRKDSIDRPVDKG